MSNENLRKDIKKLFKDIDIIDKNMKELPKKYPILAEKDILKVMTIFKERKIEVRNQISNLTQEL